MSWKRQLFLWHRWTGIVLCLFFALWFLSGIFMMYVGFPELTRAERFAGSQPLRLPATALAPDEAVARLTPQDFLTKATPTAIEYLNPSAVVTARSIRLAMIAERPAYVISASNGAQPRVVFADNGEVLREVTPEAAQLVAASFVKRSGAPASVDSIAFDARIQTDQWTVSGLNEHRPLLRFRLNDAAGTVLYVSSTTGEVVRDTHSTERALNYLGAVTHWIYPTFIRKYPLLWEWIVDVLSVIGVVLAVSGLWIGILRWNRRAPPGKRQVPYKGLMRWHYFTGIVFGLVTITWVFSGLMSMNPLSINPPRRASADQQLLYSGKRLTPSDFQLPVTGFGDLAMEAELIHYDGQPFYRVTDADMSVRLVAGAPTATRLPDWQTMASRAPQLIPDAPLVESKLLTSYDNYFYSRHPERGDRRLPVLRVRFGDEQSTWFHLDPITGQLLDRSTFTNRVYRWLYSGLHSFDIWWLWQRRPLWDICVITFSLGGLLLSVIGVVIGWRRLRYKPMRRASSRVDEIEKNSLAIRVQRS
ncbi:PepSY domain-containing protein [Steroidobacter cummioxidans]|uniref:PepSY domain-containing protein n=1 Tax=Steroidobacter cummioxidans TaxID=1803913 RepID=UPI000E31EA48|nr:PepSY domain-containing protein [Steroidobacter cummioxidans]